MSICFPNSYVNPNVLNVGVSKLRKLNATKLRGMDKTLVIQENDQPLAVLLRYEEYLAMQKQLMAVLETKAVLSDKDEMAGITSGIEDLKAGRTQPFEKVRISHGRAKEKV
jgi:PHD/YefM family antitoxin component YafN of YafNO toxin-antitoxin module